MSVGTSLQFAATQNGSGDNIIWSISNPGVATISPAGLVSAIAPGVFTVTATEGSASSSASGTVVAPATKLTPISVTPQTSSLSVGTSLQFAATQNGSGDNIIWSISNPGVATISPAGLVSAIAPGVFTVTATEGSASSSASGTVVAPATKLTPISVTPQTSSLSVGTSLQFAATQNGSGDNIIWSISNPGVATISPAGLVSAIAPGVFTVTATEGSASSSASGTVVAPATKLTPISVTPQTSSLSVGASLQFAATQNGSGDNIIWSISNSSVATISPAGLVSAIAPGVFTVTATEGSASSSASGTVVAPATKLTPISVTPQTSSLSVGTSLQFAATQNGSGDNIIWSISNPGVATISPAGLVSAIAPGVFTVTATEGSASSSASGTVVAPATKLTPISVTPQTSSLSVGTSLQFAATQNGSGDNIIWSISNPGVATISPAGLVSAIAPGVFTVTATEGSASSSASGTVVAPATNPNQGVTAYPIPVYTGIDFSGYQTFNVSDFGASGSGATLTCGGVAHSRQLICDSVGDFAVGQGIRIVGGGRNSVELAPRDPPMVIQQGNGATGAHTYCYIFFTVDPLGAISAPSQQSCIANEPLLSDRSVRNGLGTTISTIGPSPVFLWYVSQDNGPYRLLNVTSFDSTAIDMGQRIGSRGGWPDDLPLGNPNIAKNEDLFTTVQAVDGGLVDLADPLASTVMATLVDHDDTSAAESAILAGVNAGGGNVVFGSGSFNLRRPAFSILVNKSYAYPDYSTNVALDPWWAIYSYLYIPNGSVGHINILGAGRATTLITPPDQGGASILIAIGNEQRAGAINTPVLSMNDVPAGSTQITLTNAADAATLSPGDDVFIYSGTFNASPDVDTTSAPNTNHFSEINTVKSVTGNTVTLVRPTSKHYHDDGGSSWGIDKMPITPHDIALQHLTIKGGSPIIGTGDVIGLLVNDLKMIGVISNGAFGGGFKTGYTIENSEWTFGVGTSGWGQTNEYDQITDLAFINNEITGYAAPGSEAGSGMAKLYATEGTSQVLVTGNTLDHVSVLADQTNDFYVTSNAFTDGVVGVGEDFRPSTPGTSSNPQPTNRSFLSFDSQISASIDHNTFTFTSDFGPDWILRLADFKSGNISDNSIVFAGNNIPGFAVSTANGSVARNQITMQTAVAGNIIQLTPDLSPDTAMSSFLVENNTTIANVIYANVAVTDSGFTDTAPVCLQNNIMLVSKGMSVIAASSIVNQTCQ